MLCCSNKQSTDCSLQQSTFYTCDVASSRPAVTCNTSAGSEACSLTSFSLSLSLCRCVTQTQSFVIEAEFQGLLYWLLRLVGIGVAGAVFVLVCLCWHTISFGCFWRCEAACVCEFWWCFGKLSAECLAGRELGPVLIAPESTEWLACWGVIAGHDWNKRVTFKCAACLLVAFSQSEMQEDAGAVCMILSPNKDGLQCLTLVIVRLGAFWLRRLSCNCTSDRIALISL